MTATATLAASARQPLVDTIRDAVRRARTGDPSMTIADAVALIPADQLDGFWHSTFDDDVAPSPLTTGLGASPGVACGEIVLSADDALRAAAEGRAVILVRPQTTPDDVLGMQAARGILTCLGGVASHAAVVARGWGIPAVVGASAVTVDNSGICVGHEHLAAGAVISIDGRSGEVFVGHRTATTTEVPDELTELLGWADDVRAAAQPPVGVRANADTAIDATHARRLGAEGIGLCRTEHMFLVEDRLPLMRRFILADDPEVERRVLEELETAQAHDFAELLEAMQGLPITIRLLDPPLHEFLPDPKDLLAAEARGELSAEGRVELAALERLREVNPMIATRGVRLGVVRPGLYPMQVRALCRALSIVPETPRPDVEIMVPLVVDPSEMLLVRRWVDEAVAASELDPECAQGLKVGAMIETPRAALVAEQLAGVSDFFSFGTNDLTQLTVALSRDDVGARLLPEYIASGLFDTDPFEALDQAGVGRLMQLACDDARRVRPTIKIGVCGEHAGHPASARFLTDCGVDYVSCSPYRLPTARLAIAQALLGFGRVPEPALRALDDRRTSTSTVSAPSASGVTSHADTTFEEHDEFVAMHALRIKGFAALDAVVQISGLETGLAAAILSQSAAIGHCRHLQSRDLWQLLPPGRERHEQLLACIPADVINRLREPYSAFRPVNDEFKELCARWQTRHGEPNDHTDAAYDSAQIEHLQLLHAQAAPIVERFAAAAPRLGGYLDRLSEALARTVGGETTMFTGVLCGSYHDAWMELHEDLIQILGVDRKHEGSF